MYKVHLLVSRFFTLGVNLLNNLFYRLTLDQPTFAAMFKTAFVTILGLPNAGKSTFLNAVLGEDLVITNPKAQTTRHRIKGILNDKDYQLVFSDTPGIIKKQPTDYRTP